MDKIQRDYEDWFSDYKPRPAVYVMKQNYVAECVKVAVTVAMLYVCAVLVMAL